MPRRTRCIASLSLHRPTKMPRHTVGTRYIVSVQAKAYPDDYKTMQTSIGQLLAEVSFKNESKTPSPLIHRCFGTANLDESIEVGNSMLCTVVLDVKSESFSTCFMTTPSQI